MAANTIATRVGQYRWIGSLIVLCLATSGCTREDVDGNTTIYSYELWAGMTAAVGGVVLIALGILGFLAKGIAWLQKAALTLCAIGAVVIAISVELFTEKTTVAADHAVVKDASFCFGSTEYKLVFADMMTFDKTVEERRGRRGRKNNVTVFVASMRTGGEPVQFDSTPVVRHALPTLVRAASDAGVSIGYELASEAGMTPVNFGNPGAVGGQSDGFSSPMVEFPTGPAIQFDEAAHQAALKEHREREGNAAEQPPADDAAEPADAAEAN